MGYKHIREPYSAQKYIPKTHNYSLSLTSVAHPFTKWKRVHGIL